MELCSNPCPLKASISPQRQSPRRPHGPLPWPTDARTAPRSTPKPSYVPQTREVTPEVTLGARLRGGEIASTEFLLVVYAHSPAHQGSTSVSPARCYSASAPVGSVQSYAVSRAVFVLPGTVSAAPAFRSLEESPRWAMHGLYRSKINAGFKLETKRVALVFL